MLVVAAAVFDCVTHPAQLPIDDFLAQCQVSRTRRSGPGGQHRNKVETAVVIEHQPTGIRAEAAERRSQEQNRQVALHRLRVRLALESRTEPAAEPSSLWRSRITAGRISVNSNHEDFPALLAEALDHIFSTEADLAAVASSLQVSSSQLVKLLKAEPSALALVNRERSARNLPSYR